MESLDRPSHASPPPGARGRDRREDRPQPDALLDMLGVLETALRAAIRSGDIDGVREATAARVACWVALADLAADVHPGYQLACQSVARWEQETAEGRRTAPPAPSRGCARLLADVRREPLVVVGSEDVLAR